MTTNLIEQARKDADALATTSGCTEFDQQAIDNSRDTLRQLAAALEQRAEVVGDKPCLVSGECKHGNWCSDVYCQEHCRFVRELDQLDALAELCDEATGGWDLPPHAVRRIGALARKARAALAQQARPQWRTIDSAPKDGTQVLVPSRWSGLDADIASFDPGFGAWFSAKLEMPIDEPTHWMPLPEAPK